jgi:hypothetical protein
MICDADGVWIGSERERERRRGREESSLALLQVLRALPAGFFLLLRPKERTKEKGVSSLGRSTLRPRI